MNITYTVQLIRGEQVEETRWWYRRVLRRKTRWVQAIIFSGPAPDFRLTSNLNEPDTLFFPANTRVEGRVG